MLTPGKLYRVNTILSVFDQQDPGATRYVDIYRKGTTFMVAKVFNENGDDNALCTLLIGDCLVWSKVHYIEEKIECKEVEELLS